MEPQDEEKVRTEAQAQEPEAAPQPAAPAPKKKRSSTWAIVVLVIIIVGVPLWYMTVLMPRLRVAGFEAVLGDVAPSGEVCFIDESGGDAMGMAKAAFAKENFTVVAKTDEWKKVPGDPIPSGRGGQSQPGAPPARQPDRFSPQRVYIESIKWAGTNQYEIKAGWMSSPEYGSGATYIFEVSLFGYNLADTKDRWVKAPEGEGSAGKPGMPAPGGMGAPAPSQAPPGPNNPGAGPDPTK